MTIIFEVTYDDGATEERTGGDIPNSFSVYSVVPKGTLENGVFVPVEASRPCQCGNGISWGEVCSCNLLLQEQGRPCQCGSGLPWQTCNQDGAPSSGFCG